MKRVYTICLLLFIPLIGFIISLASLSDYGVNWDSLQHFVRGQIYFRYITTGKKDTKDIPDICRNEDGVATTIDQKTGRVCDKNHIPRVSFYEKSALDYSWTEKMTIGHPPLTDILIAFSNQVFFKTLGILGDIESHNVFGVIVTFIMATMICFWSYQTYGVFASIVSVLVIYCYPLLFAEQHFNMKDPAVAMYFTGFMYFLWLGITRKRSFWIFASSIFAGLSIGTKFNIVFAPFIVMPWILFYTQSFHETKKKKIWEYIKILQSKIPLPMGIAFVFMPCIAFFLFFVSYPALWNDPITKILSVIAYYQTIGGSRCLWYPMTPQWVVTCSDVHTLRLFFTTLPIITILFTSIGIFGALYALKNKQTTGLLWILWLAVTLGRATFPITVLYGGSLRQILEFIAPTALLAGFGAYLLKKKIIENFRGFYAKTNHSVPLIVSVIICIGFLPVIIEMHRLHPNENVYFNKIAGGLSGAVEKKFSSANNTFGNAYKQGIDWINKNAEEHASVSLLLGITSAVPSVMFRSDIHYLGTSPNLYGPTDGYLLELNDGGMDVRPYYNMKYASQFLVPVFQKTVDGIPLVTVWKNDTKHMQNPNLFLKEQVVVPKIIGKTNNEVILKLSMPISLKRLEMRTENTACQESVRSMYIFTSVDGNMFTRKLYESAKFYDLANTVHADAAYAFTGEETQWLKLYTFGNNFCDLSTIYYSVYRFLE